MFPNSTNWTDFKWLSFVKEQIVQRHSCLLMYCSVLLSIHCGLQSEGLLLKISLEAAFDWLSVAYTGRPKRGVYSCHYANASWSGYVGSKYTKREPIILTSILSIRYECHFQKLIAQNELFSKKDAFRHDASMFFCVILILLTVQFNHDMYITHYMLYQSWLQKTCFILS